MKIVLTYSKNVSLKKINVLLYYALSKKKKITNKQ